MTRKQLKRNGTQLLPRVPLLMREVPEQIIETALHQLQRNYCTCRCSWITQSSTSAAITCGSLTAWVQLHALVAENAHVRQGIEKASPWQVASKSPWEQDVFLPVHPIGCSASSDGS